MRIRLQLLALLALLPTLTISDFPLIPNLTFRYQGRESQNSWVLAQTPDSRKAEAERLMKQGIEQYDTGQIDAASQSYQQALAIYREIKDRAGEGGALTELGLVDFALGNYQEAINRLELALPIAREVQNRFLEAGILNNLGPVYYETGNYPKAIEVYQQSLVIAKEIKNSGLEGQSLGNLANAYLALGEYGKALELYQQRLVLAREIKDRRGEGNVLGNLGAAYDKLADYSKAIEYYQQSLAIAREIKDRSGEAKALNNLGLVYSNVEDYAKAIDYYQQVLPIAQEIKDPLATGAVLGNLGLVYYSQGNYDKAIDYYQQGLAIAQTIKAPQSAEIVLGNLGLTYADLGDYPKEIEYPQQKLAIARAIKDRQAEGIALNNLGVALYKSGNLKAATGTLSEGMKVYESLQAGLGSNDANKVSLFEKQVNTYRTLQQVLIAQNQVEAALEISERSRARAFAELLAKRLSPNQATATSLTPLTSDKIKQIASSQNSTIVEYSINYDNFQVKGKKQTKDSVLYIWVIKPTGEVVFRKVDLKPLWQQQNTSLIDLVNRSRESIGVRGRGLQAVAKVDEGSQAKQLQQLHQLLIDPVADLLPTDPNAPVIFIPQDSLFLTPFVALQDKQVN